MIPKLVSYLISILLLNVVSFAQISPKTFLLNNENNLSKEVSENPASNSISDIVTIGDTIWLGTSRGVSLSTDGGENWTNFFGSNAFSTESIAAIAFDKYTGNFWASTAHSIERDNQSLPEGSGLRFTSDGGTTWHSISQPLDDPNDSTIIYGINDGINLPKVRALPVTVAIQNLIYDIAFTPNTIWISTFAGGLRKARVDSLITNPNYRFERVLLPSDGINQITLNDTIRFPLLPVSGSFGTGSLNHRVFSVISTNDSTLYVGTAGGINKSTDGGISWQKFNHLNQDNPISGNFIVALAYNDYDNTAWAATWKAEGESEFYAVSSSENSGESWSTFLQEEKVHNFGFKFNNVIAPSDNGAFRTTNKGASWILPTSIIDSETKIPLSTNIFYSAASQNNFIWVGSADGLARINETSGLPWVGDWKVYFASQSLASSDETYAYPNPFSPKLDRLKIKYSTGGKDASVTIRVFDFGMNLVKTVIQNVQRGFPIHTIDGSSSAENGVIDFWDGKDDAGNTVSNGVYFYRVEIDDKEPVYGKILVVQ